MPPKDPIVPIVEAKLEQVPALLTELGLDAWLVFVRESSVIHDPSLDLVVGTNVTWHSAFVLTAQGGRTAIVGQLDAANLRAHGHYPEVIPYTRGITEELRALLSRIDPRRVAINYSMSDPASDGLSHGMYLSLLRALEGTPYAARLESSTALVAALRGRKSALELERIRAACRATTAIFQRLTPWLRAGKSEKEVASRILDETSREAGLELAWDAEHCPSVFTGPDSAGAHAGPTDRKIEPGHLVNVDFGVRKMATARISSAPGTSCVLVKASRPRRSVVVSRRSPAPSATARKRCGPEGRASRSTAQCGGASRKTATRSTRTVQDISSAGPSTMAVAASTRPGSGTATCRFCPSSAASATRSSLGSRSRATASPRARRSSS
jgi:hypothetical protein